MAVMRNSRAWAAGGIIVLLIISFPMLNMRVSETGNAGLSPRTDTYQSLQILQDIGLTGALSPYQLLVDFGEQGFYHPSSVRDVSELTRELEALPEVEAVFSATTAPGVPRLFLYQYYARQDVALGSEIAPLARATVGASGQTSLLLVYPQSGLGVRGAEALESQITTLSNNLLAENGASAQLGGGVIREREWADALYASMPTAIALVYLATFVLLGLAFRSLVVPLKCIFLNTLTVTGAFGLITLIFQEGIGARLVGLNAGLGFVDTSVPLFVFAIVFGLSMDYEVFLVSRIFENHERGLSDEDAVIQAMATTGSVISSAATIMVVVFSVFIFSEVILIKTLGLGLATAVFLDATIVRLTVLPAVMNLAGKWTWWLPAPMRKLADRVSIDVGHD
jgi:RND superfamily putative drug exporter